jgi:uncharacterized protein
MSADRFFMDTVFIQALLNRRDRYHAQALALLPGVRTAHEVYVSEAILVEVANALSAINRSGAVRFVRECYRTTNIRVVTVDTPLLSRALDLYEARPDKAWGLTDCISFVLMAELGLAEALTADVHFRQAGFRCLLSASDP